MSDEKLYECPMCVAATAEACTLRERVRELEAALAEEQQLRTVETRAMPRIELLNDELTAMCRATTEALASERARVAELEKDRDEYKSLLESEVTARTEIAKWYVDERARREKAEAALNRDQCWHCHSSLIPQQVRCDECPEECDDEDCDEPGCNEDPTP